MKANEARRLADAYSNFADVCTLYAALTEVIRDAASKGRVSIVHPFTPENLNLSKTTRTSLTPAQEKGLRARLATDGFKVVDHADPDFGNPSSGPYIEVSWRE